MELRHQDTEKSVAVQVVCLDETPDVSQTEVEEMIIFVSPLVWHHLTSGLDSQWKEDLDIVCAKLEHESWATRSEVDESQLDRLGFSQVPSCVATIAADVALYKVRCLESTDTLLFPNETQSASPSTAMNSSLQVDAVESIQCFLQRPHVLSQHMIVAIPRNPLNHLLFDDTSDTTGASAEHWTPSPLPHRLQGVAPINRVIVDYYRVDRRDQSDKKTDFFLIHPEKTRLTLEGECK